MQRLVDALVAAGPQFYIEQVGFVPVDFGELGQLRVQSDGLVGLTQHGSHYEC